MFIQTEEKLELQGVAWSLFHEVAVESLTLAYLHEMYSRDDLGMTGKIDMLRGKKKAVNTLLDDQ